MMENPNFEDDQYFFMDKTPYREAMLKIEKLIDEDVDDGKNFERVWIPENQVTGKVRKIGRLTFEEIDAIFARDIVPEIERRTNLKNLELVAVRRNVLNANQMVTAHSDTLGYVLMLDVLSDNSSFEGGNVVFTKDDGSVVDVSTNDQQLLIAKCTNEHGVSRIVRGERASIALFARPKE